jgi:hypothetical protein
MLSAAVFGDAGISETLVWLLPLICHIIMGKQFHFSRPISSFIKWASHQVYEEFTTVPGKQKTPATC